MKINQEKIGQKMDLIGQTKKISDPYVVIISIKFECPSCGMMHTIKQVGEKVIEPAHCPCGRKGGFREHERETRDQMDFILNYNGEEKIKVYLPSLELIDKFKTIKGSRVKVSGEIKEEFLKRSVKGNLVLFASEVNEK